MNSSDNQTPNRVRTSTPKHRTDQTSLVPTPDSPHRRFRGILFNSIRILDRGNDSAKMSVRPQQE